MHLYVYTHTLLIIKTYILRGETSIRKPAKSPLSLFSDGPSVRDTRVASQYSVAVGCFGLENPLVKAQGPVPKPCAALAA